MIVQIQDCLVSEAVLQEAFACDLNSCQGACCVEGEAGAPLEPQEATFLAKEWPKIKPYIPIKGQEAIFEQGPHVKGFGDELETPLVDGKECAYTVFSETGMAQYGIEKAYKAGAISQNKPISCHLYPVRLNQYTDFTAVNYHQWHICKAACSLGAQQKIPVYEFIKTALIRKFGQAWYDELVLAAQELSN